MKAQKLIPAILFAVVVLSGCRPAETTTPQRKNLVDAVFASGNVVMKDQYLVTALSEGYLQKTLVEEGDSVFTGQLLFQVQDNASQAQLESAQSAYRVALENSRPDSPTLQKLNQQLLKAQNQFRTDSLNFNRYKNLIKTNAVSKAEYDRAKLAFESSKAEQTSLENTIKETRENLNVELANAKANLVTQQNNSSYFSLTSFTNGIVLQKYKENGELVKRGETLAEIGAGEFIARLQISEEDISRVTTGQEVYIELNTHKNQSFKGEITKVYPAFNVQEQSFIAEASFSETVKGIKAGTQLQANVVVEKKSDALVIPASFLLTDDYVLKGNSNQKIQVKTGIKTADWVEILGGVTESDKLYLPRKK
jgi:multidrug efflux pump subunit AcrA (membrane-fusion protein)